MVSGFSSYDTPNIPNHKSNHKSHTYQSPELQDGIPTICASMTLDDSGSDLATRLSNRLYESCRSGSVSLPGFPDFQPLVSALKEGNKTAPSTAYKVCVQHHDKLKILESMAGKWVNTELLKDRAMEAIENHNASFNPDGEMWVEDRRLYRAD